MGTNMKIQGTWLAALLLVAVSLLSSCASTPQGDLGRPAAEVKVYTMGELNGSPYQVVSRIWVDSWRTAIWRPTYPSEEEAITGLRVEAARLGANGLVNVFCLNQSGSTWFQSAKPVVLCYGNAIRVRQSGG